jgi:hypothetical protein
VDSVSLQVVFNLHFLKMTETNKSVEAVTYDPKGNPVKYKSRPFDSNEYKKKSNFSWAEFHSHDFDKWYKVKNASTLSKDFTVIFGFNDICN